MPARVGLTANGTLDLIPHPPHHPGVDRRRFLLISLAGAVAAPLAAQGPLPERITRIGMLRSENRPLDDRLRQNIAALRDGLQDEGYAEGRHYRID